MLSFHLFELSLTWPCPDVDKNSWYLISVLQPPHHTHTRTHTQTDISRTLNLRPTLLALLPPRHMAPIITYHIAPCSFCLQNNFCWYRGIFCFLEIKQNFYLKQNINTYIINKCTDISKLVFFIFYPKNLEKYKLRFVMVPMKG